MEKNTKTYELPMPITSETIRDFGIDPKSVVWKKIGNRKKPCITVPVSEDVYRVYMRAEDSERKAIDREGRCMVKGKSGRLIRCPEENRCVGCPNAEKVMRAENRPRSLDSIVEHSLEPVSDDSFEDDVLYGLILGGLIECLAGIKPVYGKIFRMLYDQLTQKEISERLNIPARTVSGYVSDIRSIIQPMMKNVFDR